MMDCANVEALVTQQHELIALLIGTVVSLLGAITFYLRHRNGNGHA